MVETQDPQFRRESGRLQVGEHGFDLASQRGHVQRVVLAERLLSPDSSVLAAALADRPALIVMTPSVLRHHGARLRAYLHAARPGQRHELMVVRRTEATKDLAAVTEICDRAAATRLPRRSPIVAFGGGVCSDLCGLAAALHRRGVPHIKVPTTLVGLIDAGIGTKNAVNHDGRKSGLGSFHPPEYSLLDPGFLRTLPHRQLRNGLAEAIKLAIAADPVLFEHLETHGAALAARQFRPDDGAITELIRRAVQGMLEELALSPYESIDKLRRKMDLGHTFSPEVESASDHLVLHGEAVAVDLALSSQLAAQLGILRPADLERVLALLETCGLPLTWSKLSADALWASLAGVVDHRDGELNLVVPTGIGGCVFLDLADIDLALVRSSIELLRRRATSRSTSGARLLSLP
ncbi:3-dehydroquinate synthase [Kribbella albertanoniae]|uniref:2-epi-5-epi-valiolone synthase n=1 Tax=Kribbella albertanoniae TaxID=1266829 RepID=A0A4R4QIU3_9ACTN|nr:sedoheptulose 7-phosphate cyclase [Kribbella albertanoniae]TDC35510.1 iron-containing alcohol dehydrogenase [Kribbella albertanoniae]